MSRSSSPIIRRATRTYGRRRDTVDFDTSFEAANTSIDSRDDPNTSISINVEFDVPPSSDDQDALNTSPLSEHASDADDDDAADKVSSGFQWSWKAKLKEIDDGNYEVAATTDALTSHNATEEDQATQPASPTSLDQRIEDVFSGSLSTLTSSSYPSSSAAPTQTTRHTQTYPASDSEPDQDVAPSTPQTSPHHTLGTPKSRSSPTPPTSIEMPQGKGKGKQREIAPLRFDNGDHSGSDAKPTLGKLAGRKGKKKDTAKRVKAPTKKEQLETQKVTARIIADQPVSIPRVQHKKYNLSNLLGRIDHSYLTAVPAESSVRSRSRTPPIPSTSDPIQAFSSSPEMGFPTKSRRASLSKPFPERDIFVSNGLLDAMEVASSASDNEFPEGSTLVKEAEKEREAQERQQQLLEVKRRALEQQMASAYEEDDSDLEIVDDPKSVARDEAQLRRGMAARGIRPSKGRSKQLALAGSSVRREDTLLPAGEVETRQLLKMAAVPAFVATTGKGADKPKLSRAGLNKLLRQGAFEQAERITKEKEEEWKRRGGRIKERPEEQVPAKSSDQILHEIVQKHEQALVNKKANAEEAQDSDSDEEWKPADDENIKPSEQEERQHSTSHVDVNDQADDEDEDENPFLAGPRLRRGVMRTRTVTIESDDEDDGENCPPSKSTYGRILVQDTPAAHPRASLLKPQVEDTSLGHRNSVSSLGNNTDENGTEEGTDKENDVRLSFDRGEDKENTKIAVQSPVASMTLRLGRSFSALFAEEIQASPSGSVGRGTPSGVRSPLKELPAEEEEDPFAFTPAAIQSLRLGTLGGGTLEDSPMNLGDGAVLEPAFSLKGKQRARFASAEPLSEPLQLGGEIGGFSQFVTQEENARGFDQLKADNDDLALTPEPGLLAALDVSNTFRKKADEVFEKEQVLIAQEGIKEVQKETEPEMFVDENGFLTQTKPAYISPLRMMTPSQVLRFSSPGSAFGPFSSARKPLAPLLTQDPDEDDLPRRRLRKRSDSASPERTLAPAPKLKNAFDILGKGRSPKHKKLARSEFVEGEAEESDDEMAFGFGGVKKQINEDEEDGEDQDQTLEELVDDKEMDEKTLGEEAVLEKVREHQEQDDKEVEKIHLDAVAGKYRVKRRDRGIGFEDSDSEEDEEAQRIRARAKKPRLNNDSIAALAKNAETQAFASEYSANIADDDDEFAHLRHDEMDLDPQDAEQSDGEPEVVSADQLREQLREAARKKASMEEFNPHDVSWVRTGDDDDEEEEVEPRVREVSNETMAARRPNVEEKKDLIGDADRARMARWAKSETASRTVGVTGRNTGGSAAITGHGKSKAGSALSKTARAAASTSTSASGAGAKLTKISKAPSMLSTVSNRRAKFGN